MKYRVFLLLAACALVLIYLPYLNEDFFIIDDARLVSIPQFQTCSLNNFFNGFLVPGYHVDYYPVRELSYMFDRCLVGFNYYGLSGTWYRVHNLILFFGSVFFVFEILKKLKINERLAFYSVLLVLWNPFFNESYLWISARKDVLAVLFMSASVFSFLKAIESKKNWFFLFSLILYFFSLLSKATFVLFPFAFFVLFHFKQKRKEKNVAAIASFLGLSWALFQSYFYSHFNTMSLNYSYVYRLKSFLITLTRISAGLVWDSFNLIDVCNWGEWVDIHQKYIFPGFLILLGLSYLIFRALKQRNLFFIYTVLFIATLWIPVSGLFFSHRNFYSTRYYLPIMIWLIPVLFIYLIRVISSYKIKETLLVGVPVFFLIQSIWSSQYKWTSNKNVLKVTLEEAPENVANQTFYVQELLNQKSWGRLTESESRALQQRIEDLYTSCFETKKTTIFTLCSFAMPVLINMQTKFFLKVRQDKKKLLDEYFNFLKLFILDYVPSSQKKVEFKETNFLLLKKDLNEINLDLNLVPDGTLLSVEDRLNYWGALCRVKGVEPAMVFLDKMIQNDLIYEIDIQEFISQIDRKDIKETIFNCYKSFLKTKASRLSNHLK